MTDNTNSIIIDLTQTTTTPLVGKDSIVHKQAFERLENLLKDMLKHNRLNGQNKQSVKSHLEKQLEKRVVNNTIFIHGKRGAGKTTFLKSVLNYYLNEGNGAGILPIAFIDPTVTHTHQHILVDIIVKIHMATEERFKFCCDDKKCKKYRDALNDMSEGLKLLKDYQANQAYDAQWFLIQALKESKHGQILEEKFHDYIDNVVDILGTELLIIAIDDVDTETKDAYEVLEIIRSIMTHPKVCVLLTGDESLYNVIVHQKKLESLGKTDEKQMIHLESKSDMAIHLTQQYLLKVLPAQQRLELKDLYSLIKENNKSSDKIKIQLEYLHNNKEMTNTIEGFWSDIFKRQLFLVDREVGKCVDFILQQPIRSVVQMSQSLTSDDFLNEQKSVGSMTLVDVFAKVFYNELFTEKFDMDILYNPNSAVNRIGKTMIELYARHGELETGFYARPDTNNPMFNACQIVLSALIANHSHSNQSKLGSMIATMLTTGASCNILMNYVPEYHEKDKLRNYINYIGLSNKDDIYSISAHYSPIILNDVNKGSLAIKSGVIKIRRKSKTELKDYLKNLQNYPEHGKKYIDSSGTLSHLSKVVEKLSESNDGDKVANALSVLTCRVAGHSIMTARGANDYISCYTLLAFIAELLNAQNKEMFEKIFYQRLEIPTYGTPAFIANIDAIEDDGLDDEAESDNESPNERENDLYQEIIEMLELWKIHVHSLNIQGVSAVLQGKIWTRIFYSLSRVSEVLGKNGFFSKNDKRANNIGILLHEVMAIHIASMINAVMIEESRFSLYDDNKEIRQKIYHVLLNSENVVTTLEKFEQSLSRVNVVLDKCLYKFQDVLPFTYSLMTCPLFVPFLLYSLNGFDEQSKNKWKVSTTLQGITKELLKKTDWGYYFVQDRQKNKEVVNIDMRYISALSIAHI